MNPDPSLVFRVVQSLENFWFGHPPFGRLALMRVFLGVMLLVNLLLRSYDLESQLASQNLADPEGLARLNPLAFSFSLFNWGDSLGWMWTVHVFALVVSALFLLGVIPHLTGVLALVFHLSYLHRNPAVLLEVDSLLTMGLIYLLLSPVGKVLKISFFSRHAEKGGGYLKQGNGEPKYWGGMASRVLQVHLSILYFQSGLSKLQPDWLKGVAFWHPRLGEMPFSLEILTGAEYLLPLLVTSLAVFELFFGVLIWLPRLRYTVLFTAWTVHLLVGVFWGTLPYNLTMIALTFVFIRAHHAEAITWVFSQIYLTLKQKITGVSH